MTLHRHGKVVRLGVMADAMMGPQHAAITRSFPRSLDKLAKTLGVPRCPVTDVVNSSDTQIVDALQTSD